MFLFSLPSSLNPAKSSGRHCWGRGNLIFITLTFSSPHPTRGLNTSVALHQGPLDAEGIPRQPGDLGPRGRGHVGGHLSVPPTYPFTDPNLGRGVGEVLGRNTAPGWMQLRDGGCQQHQSGDPELVMGTLG